MHTIFLSTSSVSNTHDLFIRTDKHGVMMPCVHGACTDLLGSRQRCIVFVYDVVPIPDHHFAGHLDFIDSHREFNCNFVIRRNLERVRLALSVRFLIHNDRLFVRIILD